MTVRPAQSRSTSLLEAVLNVSVGYVLALVTQWVAYPLFGIQTPLSTDLAIAAIFTVMSLARSYLLRRAFEYIGSLRIGGTTEETRHARP
jgi:hypothetical protein